MSGNYKLAQESLRREVNQKISRKIINNNINLF
jgi:hypothetical protein